MKKLIITLLFAVGFGIAVIAPMEQAAQAQAYCGHCCDQDPYGNVRIRCTLGSLVLCGNSCVCYGIQGYGFAC
jgi:hypothetical protein